MREEQKNHQWPIDGDHLFGPWMPKSRVEKYRQCVHPDCDHVETLDVSKM